MSLDHDLDPEDLKIVSLARSARARTGAVEGAAVRDDAGRSYVATTVTLPALALSAIQVAVAMAISSGAGALEAAALVTEADLDADIDLAVLREVAAPAGIRVIRADPAGIVQSVNALA
ncbi:MAG TPA: cytidine deaminase [Actinomycetes bacterium]|nr:cytidine deaminase [Actinomycetes bacterium]